MFLNDFLFFLIPINQLNNVIKKNIMAKSGNNIVTHGLSGQVGGLLVFKTLQGKTIVSASPRKSNHEPSDKQKDQQKHFQEATIYGRTVNVTPELRAQYESVVPDGSSVYLVALADFLNAPKFDEIDVSKYVGNPGNTIRIRVTDDFMVKTVEVTINDQDGSLVEQGAAYKQPNGVDWLYTAAVQNSSLTGDKIVVKASDLPGNIATSDTTL
jgi:hypothetical protein